MNRRAFLAGLVATASGLLVPDEDRKRVYSFASPPKLLLGPFDVLYFGDSMTGYLSHVRFPPPVDPPRFQDLLAYVHRLNPDVRVTTLLPG